MENPVSSNDHDLLIELRTEMRSMRDEIKELKNGVVKRVENLENDKMSKEDAKSLITKDQFEPVKKLVYGCASIILSSVVIGLVYLVIQK